MTKLLPAKPLTEADSKKLARQLIGQYRKATKGMIEYIVFGALCLHVQERIDSARGVDSAKGGRTTKGTGLKAWLAENAPEITDGTAYRYIELAEGVKTEFKLPDSADLYQILKSPKADAKQLALRGEIKDFVGGKSQRQLLISFGKFEPLHRGPQPRPKPLSAEEQHEAYVSLARQESVDAFTGLMHVEDKWQLCDDTEVRAALELTEKMAKRMRKWLETPKVDRTAPDPARFYEEGRA